MRLGQLARQLDITPDKIVSFLEKEKQITMKSHPNSKVDDDFIDLITVHFQPVVEVKEEVLTPKDKAVVEDTEVKEESVKAAEEEAQPIEKTVEKTPVEEKLEELKNSFTGPKIVGKIDLPDKSQVQVEVDGVVYDQETLENKKKEELAAERERKALEKEAKRKEELEKKKKAAEQRKVEAERQAMLESEKQNILTAEEEKKKAIILKAQQERERQLEERRKQLQKEHYLKNNAAAATTAPKKKAKKKAVVEEEKIAEVKVEQTAPKETNIFKRFLKWLNTE